MIPTRPPKAQTRPTKQSSLLTSPATDDGSRLSWVGSDPDTWEEARTAGPISAQSSGNITPRSRSNSAASNSKGIGGLIKKLSGVRRRKSSSSVKDAEAAKAAEEPPPVPPLPSFTRLSLGLALSPSVLSKDGEEDSGYGASLEARRDSSAERASGGVLTAKEATANLVDQLNSAANGGEDLTSLLYLVQAAGNKFADDDNSTTTTTPKLEPGAFEFSSPASMSTQNTVPSPKATYSFLSRAPEHAPPSTKPTSSTRSPSAPPASRRAKPAAPETDSEDDYGGESDDDIWVKKPNSAFARQKPTQPQVVPTPAPPARPEKAPTRGLSVPPPSQAQSRGRSPGRRTLGPRAKSLLELTANKLKPSTSSANVNRPLSTNPHSIVRSLGATHSLRLIVGRTAIGRKLRKGTTMMEAIEIEHQSSPSRRASTMSTGSGGSDPAVAVPEGVDASLDSALKLLANDDHGGVDTFNPTRAPLGPMPWRTAAGYNPIQSPTSVPGGMGQLPTRSGIAAWASRPAFVESHIVYLAVAGGVATNLVQPRLSHPGPSAVRSLRLRALTELSTDPSPLPSPSLPDPAHRPARSRRPESGVPRARADTASSPPAFVAAGARAPGVAMSLPPPTAKANKKSIGPGPLLMKALAEEEGGGAGDGGESDDDAHPLGVLRERAQAADKLFGRSAAGQSTGGESAAVRRAKEKADALKVELAWLKQQEVQRKAAEAEQAKVRKAQAEAEAYAREVARMRRREQEEVDQYWKAQQKAAERAREREVEWAEEERRREVERRLEEQRKRSRAAGQVPDGRGGAVKASQRPSLPPVPTKSSSDYFQPASLLQPSPFPSRSASPALMPSPARSPADVTAFQLQMQQQAQLAMMNQGGGGLGYGYPPMAMGMPVPMMLPPARLYASPAMAGSTSSLRASASFGNLQPPPLPMHTTPPRSRTPRQSHAPPRDLRLDTIYSGGSEDGHGRASPAGGPWHPRGLSTPPAAEGGLPRSRSSGNIRQSHVPAFDLPPPLPKETSAQRVQRRLSAMPPLPHSSSQPNLPTTGPRRASHVPVGLGLGAPPMPGAGEKGGRMSMQRSASTPVGLVLEHEQAGAKRASAARPASRLFLEGAAGRVAASGRALEREREVARREGKKGLVGL